MTKIKNRIKKPELIEMPMKIRMHMIQDDIDIAKCNSRTQCALACNIYRELKIPVDRVWINQAGVTLKYMGWRYHYRTPWKAAKLIKEFDEGKPVKPISYTLEFSSRTKVQILSEEERKRKTDNEQIRRKILRNIGKEPRKLIGRYGI